MHNAKQNHVTMFKMHGIHSRIGKHDLRGRKWAFKIVGSIWAKNRSNRSTYSLASVDKLSSGRLSVDRQKQKSPRTPTSHTRTLEKWPKTLPNLHLSKRGIIPKKSRENKSYWKHLQGN